MGPRWRKYMSVLMLDPSVKKQTCILYLVKSCQSLERHILADQHHHQQSDNPVHTCAHQEQTPNHRCLHRNTGSATFLQTCQLPNWQHMSIRFYFWVLLCTIVYLRFRHSNAIIFFSTNMGHYKRTFYSYGWKWAWRWPCFGTNLSALLCKSSYSYSNLYFSVTISITKQRRFVSKKGHRQPHIHWKARVQSLQL